MSKDRDKYCIKWIENTNISFVNSPVNHLNIALFPSEVFDFGDDDKSIKYICSKSNYMLELLSKSLNCSIGFRKSNEDFGGFSVNGTWNGAISLLANKSADLIMQFYTYNEDRNRIIDFSKYYSTRKLITILSVPTYKPENVLKIFFIFGVKIWILILLSLISFSLINSFVVNTNIQRFSIMIDYFAILSGQASYYLNRNHLTILIAFWLITTFFIRLLFTSDIQALLLAKRKIEIDSFEQLIERDNIMILIEANSSTHRIISQKYPKLIRRFERIAHRDPYRISVIRKIIEGTHALVLNQFTAEQVTGHYNKYPWHESKGSRFSTVGNFPIRKGLNQNIKTKLGKVFDSLIRFGIYSKKSKDEVLYNNYLDSKSMNSSDDNEILISSENAFEVISLRELLVCFVLLSIGLLLSSFVFIFESLVKKYYLP